jgi:hypothetical protein
MPFDNPICTYIKILMIQSLGSFKAFYFTYNFVATLAFGLRPRQGGCEVAGLEVDPGVTSHAPGSAKSPESVRE